VRPKSEVLYGNIALVYSNIHSKYNTTRWPTTFTMLLKIETVCLMSFFGFGSTLRRRENGREQSSMVFS